MTTAERRAILASAGAVAIAGTLHWIDSHPVPAFLAATVALAAVAYLTGEATSQLGNHLNVSAAGMVQSALGNLPELFVCLFALRAGAVDVVQATLIGSILTTAVLILGVALTVGSLRYGLLEFESRTPRMIGILLLLAVSALVLPTLAHELHLPAAAHAQELAVVCSVVLLAVFAISTKAMLRSGERTIPPEARRRHSGVWPMWKIVLILALCGVAIVLASNWFVETLKPATRWLGVSEAFAALVIVAFASNTAGITEISLALQGKADLAVSVALNGALQVAVAVIPVLVLASFFFFPEAPFTLTVPPILAVALSLSVLVVTFVCVDGRADVVDGTALIGLYALIAAIFWWG